MKKNINVAGNLEFENHVDKLLNVVNRNSLNSNIFSKEVIDDDLSLYKVENLKKEVSDLKFERALLISGILFLLVMVFVRW